MPTPGFEAAIYDRLAKHAQLALVLTDDDATIGLKLYPNVAPAAAPLPYVVYHVLAHEQSPPPSAGLTFKTLRLECVSEQYAQAKYLEELITEALAEWHGWSQGVNIRGIFPEGGEDGTIERADERVDHVVTLDFRAVYKAPKSEAQEAAAK